MVRRVLAILLAFAALAIAPAAEPQYSSELIFPLESWHNHSSSIVETTKGDLLVCWFHGSGERTADDVLIRGARWSRSARRWSAPFTMADAPGFPETNPVLFVDRRQRLFFFWPLIIAHRWETALMKYRVSTDWEQADRPPVWSFQDNIVLVPKNIAPKTKAFVAAAAAGNPQLAAAGARLVERAEDEYFSRMGWFTRTHPLELPSGRLLVPMYSDGYSFGIMAISDDAGVTWKGSEPIVGLGGVQPSIVRRNDGTLVAYLRDNGPAPKRALISESTDDGESWTDARDTDILNPGTSVEVVRLRNGHWIMVYNDLDRGRYSLVAAVSDDEGRTWPARRHLDGRPDTESASQYHYPSVIQARDDAIHVSYSYFTPEGKSIKHARFNEEWVRAGDPVGTEARQAAGTWRDRFDVNAADLRPIGDNPFIPMQPGRVLNLAHGKDTLTITVLPDTQVVDGVTAGVLEERETRNGTLVEVSRNFLATDRTTRDVYYFGEDVDNYRNGRIVSHDSAWRAGVRGARFGLMIPAAPSAGQRFYQEIAPDVAMDRVEVVSTDETVKTPAGTFEHCVHLRETTPLERDVSHKYYAPGVGLIKDDEFELSVRPRVPAAPSR